MRLSTPTSAGQSREIRIENLECRIEKSEHLCHLRFTIGDFSFLPRDARSSAALVIDYTRLRGHKLSIDD